VLQRIRGEERRAQLLDVALALFAEHGYDGTSTRQIASAAGVTEGLIFKYFPTKRDLLRAVIERYAPCRETLDREQCLADLLVEEALVHVFNGMANHLWENRLFVRMVIMESYRQGEAFQELMTIMERGPCFLRHLLDARVARGELALPDTAAAAALLGGSVFAFFQKHQHRGESEWRRRSTEFIREAVRLFLQGARPEPTRSQQDYALDTEQSPQLVRD